MLLQHFQDARKIAEQEITETEELIRKMPELQQEITEYKKRFLIAGLADSITFVMLKDISQKRSFLAITELCFKLLEHSDKLLVAISI